MTIFNPRASVTPSSYTWRPIIQSFDWITWNEANFSWDSTAYTWDNSYSWTTYGTKYNGRPIIA